MIRKLLNTLKESFTSVLPILLIVIILSFFVDFTNSTLGSFLISIVLIIIGITLFTFGSEVSMEIIGEKIGHNLVKNKKIFIPLFILFIIGIVITIAEPDLKVLAEQMTSIPGMTLILTVGIGVGLFLSISLLKIRYQLNLSRLLVIFYILIFILLIFTPKEFIPLAFDSGGVTTGPVSVPFIVALGLGLARLNVSKKESENTFGLVGLCSIGPILSVLFLGLIFKLDSNYQAEITSQYESLKEVFLNYLQGFKLYFIEVLKAVLPILGVYLYFQIRHKITTSNERKKIASGIVLTILGLTIFLAAANVGLMPIGYYLGSTIASSNYKYLLLPLGLIIGFVTVTAEPAVKVLTNQIEEITEGNIKKNVIGMCLSIGVGCSVGLALLRSLVGIPIIYILIPGYFIALLLTFFAPQMFTAIAFDSGGAASGPMTATFLLPLSIGTCMAVGGNVITDAFGLVALVAMAPLIMIQILGVIYKIKENRKDKNKYDTTIVEYDWSDKYGIE